MHPGHPYSTLFPSFSVASRAAVWGRLVMVAYHVSGTARGFIKPQSWEIRTNQICVNMPPSLSGFYVYSCVFETLSLLIPTQFPFPLSFSRKSWGAHERAWQCWTAALGQLCSFMCNLSFFFLLAARRSISLICHYFLLDQFIYV